MLDGGCRSSGRLADGQRTTNKGTIQDGEITVVMVYSFRRRDDNSDGYVISGLKGTSKYIAAIAGEIMRNSEEDVSPLDVDKQGRYDAKKRARRDGGGMAPTPMSERRTRAW